MLRVLSTVFTLSLACLSAAQPNILHIHADDHRPDGLAALGNRVLKTPNLDTLVARGMVFSHCYTQGSMVGAVCQPSRTMLLSGHSWQRLPIVKGAKGAQTLTKGWDASMSLPKVLSAAGYETWHCGKSGNEFTAALKAFDTNLSMNDPGEERRGSSQRHADAAIDFLSQRHKDRPFYIYLAPPVPHDPRITAPEFTGFYKPESIPLPAAFMPQHPFHNGEMIVRDELLAPFPRTPEDTKQQLADYYDCITGLDHHVGRILKLLKESGELENTLVIFSGDNGLSLGEHGLFGKQNLYEFGGMHVPLVIAGPGIPKGHTDALAYLMDLFPTFCEFGGAKVPAGVEGRSLQPIIQGKQEKVRDVLYTGYRNCQRAVRDQRWKLIRYPLVNKTQLFDLQADPHELANLADQPEHAAKVKEMMAVLADQMQQYGDTHPLTVDHPAPAEWSPPANLPKAKE
ncbi:MAG: arylsulfatase family protein [Verrucomicrobiaceae bacterium]|nr:arylsulfatase family protein [Verrucomicrobiaceae bacterium]